MARRMLESRDRLVRTRAVLSLASVPEVALQFCRDRFNDPDCPYRPDVALALDIMSSTEPVPEAATFLSAPSPGVRAVGIERLGRNPTPENLEMLLAALDEPNPVGKAAAHALKIASSTVSIPVDRLVPHLRNSNPWVRSSVLDMLRAREEPTPAVLPVLDDADPGVRQTVLLLLEHRPVPSSVPLLTRISRTDKDKYVRTQAIAALGASGHQDAEKALIELLRGDRDWHIRYCAVRALRVFWCGSDKDSIPREGNRNSAEDALRAALEDTNYGVRSEASETLVRMKAAEAVPLIVQSVRGLSWRQREHRRGLLCDLARSGDHRAAPLFEDVLRSRWWSWDERKAAVKGLAALDSLAPGQQELLTTERRRIEKAEMLRDFHKGSGLELSDHDTISWTPLAAAGGTGIGDIESDGFAGIEFSRSRMTEGPHVSVNLRLLQFRETGTQQLARLVNLDLGGRLVWNENHSGFYWYIQTGLSALYLDHDESERNMFGLGLYGRAGLMLGVWRKLALDIHADAHGWLGGDGNGAQAAGSAVLGVGLTYGF